MCLDDSWQKPSDTWQKWSDTFFSTNTYRDVDDLHSLEYGRGGKKKKKEEDRKGERKKKKDREKSGWMAR